MVKIADVKFRRFWGFLNQKIIKGLVLLLIVFIPTVIVSIVDYSLLGINVFKTFGVIKGLIHIVVWMIVGVILWNNCSIKIN